VKLSKTVRNELTFVC